MYWPFSSSSILVFVSSSHLLLLSFSFVPLSAPLLHSFDSIQSRDGMCDAVHETRHGDDVSSSQAQAALENRAMMNT